MKKTLIFIFLAITTAAHSQDLYNDFARVTSTAYDSVNKVQIVSTMGKSNFLVGNVDFLSQVLRQIPIVPLTTTVTGGSTSAVTDQIFGAATYHYSSGVWWNLSQAKYTLSSGLALPGQSVVMLSEDAIPAIQFETSGPHGFNVVAYPVSGANTPGNLVMEIFVNGGWTTYNTEPLGDIAYTADLSYTGSYRVRWLLVRTGAAPAIASVSIYPA